MTFFKKYLDISHKFKVMTREKCDGNKIDLDLKV